MNKILQKIVEELYAQQEEEPGNEVVCTGVFTKQQL